MTFPPKALRSFTLLMFSIFMVVYAMRSVPAVLSDPDTSWHIAAGQLIRETGHIPASDPWSFTTKNTPWYNLAWLYDVASSAIYDIGGFRALSILTITCGALLVAFMARQSLLASGSAVASFVAVMVCGNILVPGITARPHLASLALMLAMLSLLRRAENNRQYAPALNWQLPLLIVLWVNLHGAFLVAFLILSAFGFAALWEGRLADFNRFLWVAAGCLLATLINPAGAEIYYGAWRTLAGPMSSLIKEWHPPALWPTTLFTWFLLAFIGCFSLRDRTIMLADKLLALLWLVLSMSALRYTIFAAVALCPLLALCLHNALQASRMSAVYQERCDEYRSILSNLSIARNLRALAAALLLALPLSQYLLWPNGIMLSQDKEIPASEITYAAEHYPNAKVINFYNYGGYILLQARDALKPFFDGRAETAYPHTLIKDYIIFQRAEKGWESIPETYEADLILMPNSFTYLYLIDRLPGWQRVYRGNEASLYARSAKVR